MKKIPSIFARDWEKNPDDILPIADPGCDWVFRNEGIPTRKWDGTAHMVKDGKLYKRYDAKKGKPAPQGGIPCQDPDPITGHWPHWIPVDFNAPDAKWGKEAWDESLKIDGSVLSDGTYELCGPRINANPEHLAMHQLIRHGEERVNFRFNGSTVEEWFNEVKTFLSTVNIEGIVWHHPDGRMAKIKKKDFRLPRQ
jgi:hypothetical protein